VGFAGPAVGGTVRNHALHPVERGGSGTGRWKSRYHGTVCFFRISCCLFAANHLRHPEIFRKALAEGPIHRSLVQRERQRPAAQVSAWNERFWLKALFNLPGGLMALFDRVPTVPFQYGKITVRVPFGASGVTRARSAKNSYAENARPRSQTRGREPCSAPENQVSLVAPHLEKNQ